MRGRLITSCTSSIKTLPPSKGGSGIRFMKPSDMEIAAAKSRRSERPVEAASEAMAEMPTMELDWSRISIVWLGLRSCATYEAT